jgi:hypothetical protein
VAVLAVIRAAEQLPHSGAAVLQPEQRVGPALGSLMQPVAQLVQP